MNRIGRFQQIVLLTWWLCVLFQGVAWCKTRPVAMVIAGIGTLQVRRAGAVNLASLPVHGQLFAGDVISTGPNGRAKLLFGDNSQAKLGGNTRLEISAPAAPQAGTSLFRALAGEIWARLRPGSRVKTVYTNLVVRGTEFDLIVTDETTTLTVIEGEVGFSNRLGEVSVKAAQQSVASPDAPPTTPVTVANPGLIIEWTLDVENVALPLEKTFAPDGELLAQGDVLFAGGKYEAALARYQQGGETPAARLRAAYALLKLGRLDEAAAAFNALAALPGDAAPALTGVAWTELKRNRPASAQAAAEKALATPAGAASVEAHLAAGVALLRQNQAVAAEAQLRAALDANPVEQRYQARAWLALLQLARSQNGEALKEARAAVLAAPRSGLAQTSLATVGFFTGQTAESERAAQQAAKLSSDDISALLALSQAKLALGDVDGAADAAARATALDPQSPQAFYLLGVADAARRDWEHAVSSLQRCIAIAPDFFPATAALARVLVKMGRENQGLALLDAYEKAHGESADIWTARGEVLYASARYPESMAAFRRASVLRPESALSYAGLARVALDANDLTNAIEAGQKAVELAPNVGQYHAILGLAYQFSHLDSQSERSYRNALTLDPNNALALVQLGFRNREGDARFQSRTSGLAFAQGFIYDPAISRDLFRGGIYSEVTPSGSSKNANLEVYHRTQADDGRLNFLAHYAVNKDDGDRPNSVAKTSNIRQDTTYVAGNRTNIYFHAQQSHQNGGVPGTELNPVTDDKRAFRLNEGILAARHRVGSRGSLWAGVFANSQRASRTNPNVDPSLVLPFTGNLVTTLPVLMNLTKDHSFNPELRFDYNLNTLPGHASILTVGGALQQTNGRFLSNIFAANGPPHFTGQATYKREENVKYGYAQWLKQVDERFSLTGQVRMERFSQRSSGYALFGTGGTGIEVITPETTTSKTFALPSLVANYAVDNKTSLRFFASRRITDVTASVFAPVSTLLTTEEQALPLGAPDLGRGGDLRLLELDAERRFSATGLLKVFAFHSTGRNLLYDFSNYANPTDYTFSGNATGNALPLDRVRRQGIGMRYEDQLSRSLFGHANLSLSNTTASSTFSFFDFVNNVPVTAPAIFNGQSAPYQPKTSATVGLNYIDPRGNKAGIDINYNGSFFADTVDPNATVRPRFPAKTTVNLLLAREPSVRSEVFFQVVNLFDARQIVFNSVPVGGRRFIVGATLRFR